MMKRLTIVGLFLSLTSPAYGQQPVPLEGRWAIKAEGKIVTLIDVRQKAKGLEVEHCRLSEITLTSNHLAYVGAAIEAPQCERLRVLNEGSKRDQLRLVPSKLMAIQGEGNRLTINKVSADVASLTIEGAPMDDVMLVRVPNDANLTVDFPVGQPLKLDDEWPDNPDIKALFDADQAARETPDSANWQEVAKQDAARREATQKLLDDGKLRSAEDYYLAAFIFQHGDKPDDYLKAHSLAVISAAKGNRDARWIAAATLDRYLVAIGQKQIYGTQYSRHPDKKWTQEPYDRSLISDALRRATGVPSLADQNKKLQEMGKSPALRQAQD